MRVDVPTCDRPAARCTDSIRVAIATDADDHAANLTGWSRPMTIGAGPVPRHFARILHRVAHAGLRGGDQPRCAAKLPGVERRVFGLAFRPGTATVIKPAPFLPAKRRERWIGPISIRILSFICGDTSSCEDGRTLSQHLGFVIAALRAGRAAQKTPRTLLLPWRVSRRRIWSKFDGTIGAHQPARAKL
jgi:hypothetical protein